MTHKENGRIKGRGSKDITTIMISNGLLPRNNGEGDTQMDPPK
jgi:hypothetical protein